MIQKKMTSLEPYIIEEIEKEREQKERFDRIGIPLYDDEYSDRPIKEKTKKNKVIQIEL